MTLDQFSENYCFRITTETQVGRNYILITEVIDRNSNAAIDRIKSTIDLYETDRTIRDSRTAISLVEWSWDKIIDQYKRFQMDYFAQRFQIDGFFPLIADTNILAGLYCNID